jgi:hypothetical protein
LAGALSSDEKIRQSAPLFWFGLRNDGRKPQPKKQLKSLPAFLEHGSAKKIAV